VAPLAVARVEAPSTRLVEPVSRHTAPSEARRLVEAGVEANARRHVEPGVEALASNATRATGEPEGQKWLEAKRP